ncbi:MAG: methionine--tRNA ligase [bacterium]|nr:methionine--tRNA ligase [bacterium]
MSKFYITTSIAYVNAAPHIGFALEAVQADVVARWHKQEEVFFLTGTDEHGAKIARAAAASRGEAPPKASLATGGSLAPKGREADNKLIKEFVDQQAEKFKALKSALNLSWDNFIRTSDQKVHWPVAQEVWKRIAEAGDLYKKTYQGLYCVGHEAFVTQKDLVAETPTLEGRGSDRSAGDALVCKDHKKAPELIEEENWFFKLSKYTKDIELRIKNDELRIIPEGRKNEVLGLLKDDPEDGSASSPQDVSFSRPSKDLTWGVPVPGDDSQTMYVWADALTNYISGYGGVKNWEKHPADIHFIGKDILRFHAIIWPAMLLSAKLPLPKTIFVHGHILSDGQKMSKSLGNVVDPFELVKKYGSASSSQAGTDAVRYFLLREIPSAEDGDFSYEKFTQRYNADLANGLGNFAARVLTLASNYSEYFTIHANPQNVHEVVNDKIKETQLLANKKITDFKLNEALEIIWSLIHFGDQYINEKKPWERKDEKIIEANGVAIHSSVAILNNVAILLQPFLPDTADKITKSIVWEEGRLEIQKTENLFPRL